MFQMIGEKPQGAEVVSVKLWWHPQQWMRHRNGTEITFKAIGKPYGQRWQAHGVYPDQELPKMETKIERNIFRRVVQEALELATGRELTELPITMIQGPWNQRHG